MSQRADHQQRRLLTTPLLSNLGASAAANVCCALSQLTLLTDALLRPLSFVALQSDGFAWPLDRRKQGLGRRDQGARQRSGRRK